MAEVTLALVVLDSSAATIDDGARAGAMRLTRPGDALDFLLPASRCNM
jgi:hypothetical protein